MVTAAGVIVAVTAAVGLVGQAARGAQTVNSQRQPPTTRNASLDNAFFRCLDIQARSLVSPGQPVTLYGSNLADFVTLLQGVGSWVTIADSRSDAVAGLALRDHVSGPGACLGTVVVAVYTPPRHGVRVRVGSGASVPGNGPPPATPL
jgi:hypothetical protein